MQSVKDLNPNDCKYPNIIAEMQERDFDFKRMAYLMKKREKTARNYLINGSRNFKVSHLFDICNFLNMDVEYFSEQTLRIIGKDGVSYREKVLDLISATEINEKLAILSDNHVKCTDEQYKDNLKLNSISNRATDGNNISYAEFTRLVNCIATINEIYKSWEYDTTFQYIENNPQDAAKQLIEMFNILDTHDKCSIFRATKLNIKLSKTKRKCL